MRALLDVNVLIALLDASHVHHQLVRAWLSANIRQGWASCPITQIGCIRIMSQPAYPNPHAPAEIAERLRLAASDRHHVFWAADTNLLAESRVDWRGVLSARHATDVYLLALAAERRGRFATLDRHVPIGAVPGAEARHLVVIR